MVSLAMWMAIGVIVLITAVDGGDVVIWNLTRKDPDCEAQRRKIGEAKDGEKCGPSTARKFSEDPTFEILTCCESALVCKKGRNEYRCKVSKRQRKSTDA